MVDKKHVPMSTKKMQLRDVDASEEFTFGSDSDADDKDTIEIIFQFYEI